MSPLGKFRSPLFSRPWFAALVMTVGVSAMAFGAYYAENPPTFSSKTVHTASAPVPADVVHKAEIASAPVPREIPTINLDEMRIVGTATHRRPAKPSLASACTPGWRTLEIGPATQQVRELCAETEDSPAKPTRLANPNALNQEHLAPPRTHFGRLDAIQAPAKVESLSDLFP
jgi:hypothetical protein